jgi:hypothetical protein
MALLTAVLVLSGSPAEVLGGTSTGVLKGEATPPDTLRPDTLRPDTLRPDTLRSDTLPSDTLRPDPIPGDTLEPTDPAPDTLTQVLPRNLPTLPGGTPPRPEAGVWVWDRSELLGTEALTLHDLLTLVPGLILLRGGDYGTPVAATTGGFGPGQVRVFLDGIEDPPKEGGVVDLSQVGLAGVDEVRVERRPGELRVHLTTLQLTEGRPYTHLDVGTGDLRTNLFRATFAHPSILGGTFLVGLDRLDTEGDGPDNEGASFGTRLRYTHFQGDRGGVAVDYRGRTARRPVGIYSPREVNRSDWTVQGRWLLGEDLVGEAFLATSRVEAGGEAAPASDTLLPLGARREAGVRFSGEVGPGWVRAGTGIRSGEGWPSSVLEVEGGANREGLGGFSASWDREGWRNGESGHALSARAWTEPRRGISLFGDVQDLRRGIPFLVPRPLPDEESGPENGVGEADDPDDPEPIEGPSLRFTERSGLRVGARAEWRGVDLSAAYLLTEGDSLAPMGLPFDRNGFTTPAGRRSGVEVAGRLPLDRVLEGLHVRGHAQFWDPGAWRYFPDRSWLGALSWRHQGYGSNLEIWTDVGTRGRDSMLTPIPAEGTEGFFEAPMSQSWFARLQIRVITVRVFVQWENFTVRDDNLEFPGRPQPRTRALYGIRWTMWN